MIRLYVLEAYTLVFSSSLIGMAVGIAVGFTMGNHSLFIVIIIIFSFENFYILNFNLGM